MQCASLDGISSAAEVLKVHVSIWIYHSTIECIVGNLNNCTTYFFLWGVMVIYWDAVILNGFCGQPLLLNHIG